MECSRWFVVHHAAVGGGHSWQKGGGPMVVIYVVIGCKGNAIWPVAFASSGATTSTYGGMRLLDKDGMVL